MDEQEQPRAAVVTRKRP